MKILFIHEVNYREKVVFEMHEFPELLSLAGHDVHFLEFPEGTGVRNISLRSMRQTIFGKAYPEAKVTLVTPPTIGGGFFDRFLAPISVIPQLRNLIRNGEFDVIVLYAVPTYGWQTVRIARKAGVPVVFRALDVSHLIRKGLTSQLVKLAERYVYRRATIVSANNLVLGQYVAELGGRNDTATIDFPPLDLAHFATQSRNQMRTKMGIDEDAFVVSYMGSLFTFSGLIQVVSDFAAVSQPTDRLVIIGGGDIDKELKQKVKELNIEGKTIFTGIINYSELPDYLSVSDVLINPFESVLVTNLALPHKVLQYLATGIPIVSTELSGLFHSLGNQTGIHWVNSPELVIEACMNLKNETHAEKLVSAERGKEFVNRNFSKSATLAGFVSTLTTAKTKLN